MKTKTVYLATAISLSSLAFLFQLTGESKDSNKDAHDLRPLSSRSVVASSAAAAFRNQLTPNGPENAATSLVSRLGAALPEEALLIGDELVAAGFDHEASIIAALRMTESAEIKGLLANVSGRIGSDAVVQAALNAAAMESDMGGRMTIINGLASGIDRSSSAGFLATAALVTSDPVLLVPVVEVVSRCGDIAVFHELRDMKAEPSTTEEQRSVLDQMVTGIQTRIGVPSSVGGVAPPVGDDQSEN